MTLEQLYKFCTIDPSIPVLGEVSCGHFVFLTQLIGNSELLSFTEKKQNKINIKPLTRSCINKQLPVNASGTSPKSAQV